MDEVRVSQTIIAQARQVLLAIDGSKLKRAAPVRVGDMGDVDFLVTDTADARLAEAARTAGTVVVETDRDGMSQLA
ncbi:hypothetical protein GCM10020258_33640 [Sphingomonas yabuuchiae]